MISVLVRTHNRSTLLRKCLVSLDKQLFKGDYEIVVIDSASTDNTSLVVKEFSSINPKIRYAYESIAGAARARKKGLEVASGDILVWIDDDCTAEETWLKQIVKVFSMDVQADIVGGQVILDWEDQRPHWFPNELEPALGKQKLSDMVVPVRSVNGANIAYKSSVARQVNLDLTALGPAGGSKKRTSEDVEFCRQARMRGAEIIYTPEAVVYHYVPKEHATLQYLLERFYAFGVSDAVRQQLDYPNDLVDWSKRIIKGFLVLLKNLLLFLIKIPLRLFSYPVGVLVDGVRVVSALGYVSEEALFFVRLLRRKVSSHEKVSTSN